jgi:hypothetical protein
MYVAALVLVVIVGCGALGGIYVFRRAAANEIRESEERRLVGNDPEQEDGLLPRQPENEA